MKNKVIVVGAISSYSVKQFYDAAVQLEKKPIFLFHKGHIPDSSLLEDGNYVIADGLAIECIDQIMESLSAHSSHIFSVVPGGELAVPVTEKICDALGLPFNHGDINRFRNKKIMRDWLSEGNILQPAQYGTASKQEDIQFLAAKLRYPLIIKPVDGAASFFVKKIEHEDQLYDAVNSIISHKVSLATGVKFDGVALLEEYIEGTEYSAEVMVHDGACAGFYVTRKILSDEPYFDEIGHISLSPEYYPDECKKLVDEVISTMQVTSAVLHIEFRQDKNGRLYLIEVASRIAGDLISRLVDIKHGCSLEEFYLLSRSGNEAQSHKEKRMGQPANCFVGIRFLFGEDVTVPGKIHVVQKDSAQKYVSKSERSPRNVVNRTGFIIFQSEDYEAAISFIKEGAC